jgi:hypothetical protein
MNKHSKIITVYDTAIDHGRASAPDKDGKIPIVEYSNRRELAIIEPYLIPAESPTIFTVQNLSREMTRKIARFSSNEYQNNELAFQYGVVSVENHVDNDGKLLPTWKPTGEFITEDELALFSPAQINEIGGYVYSKSFLERKTWSKLHLPRTSQELLRQILGV